MESQHASKAGLKKTSGRVVCKFEQKVLDRLIDFFVYTFNMYSSCFDKIHFLTQFALLGRPGIAVLALGRP